MNEQNDKCYWRRGRTAPRWSHVVCDEGAFGACPYAGRRNVCAGDPRERLWAALLRYDHDEFERIEASIATAPLRFGACVASAGLDPTAP